MEEIKELTKEEQEKIDFMYQQKLQEYCDEMDKCQHNIQKLEQESTFLEQEASWYLKQKIIQNSILGTGFVLLSALTAYKTNIANGLITGIMITGISSFMLMFDECNPRRNYKLTKEQLKTKTKIINEYKTDENELLADYVDTKNHYNLYLMRTNNKVI